MDTREAHPRQPDEPSFAPPAPPPSLIPTPALPAPAAPTAPATPPAPPASPPPAAAAAEQPAAAAPGWFARLCELDFTRPLAFLALAAVFVISRAPWLDLGYGTDPDAWRVAMTAEHLLSEHEYFPSRLPGYPLHEFLTAGLVRGGWVATNLSTVLVSLAGVYVFAALVRELKLPNKGVLTVAFAFAPLLWINSVMTMDYMFALTFVLATYLALLKKAPIAAGLCLGLAVGFRLTSAWMLLPFVLYLWRDKRLGELRSFIVPAVAVGLAAYTPVLMKYGFAFLNFYDQPVAIEELIKRLGKDGLGIIGGLAVLIGLVLSVGRLRKLPADIVANANVLLWCAAIAVLGLSYLRLPHEVAYLVPVFPFGFFIMSRYMSRLVLTGVVAVVLLAGFVDVTSPDDTLGIDSSTLTSASIGRGMLLSDLETLQNQKDFAREIRQITTSDSSKEPVVVMTGFTYPELAMLYQDELEIGILERDLEAISQLSDKGQAEDAVNSVTYVWLLDFETFKHFRDQNRTIYYTPDAARSTFNVYGYRPGYFGALELPLSRENPSLGEGSAGGTDR
jgi:hypothetical protein